MRTLPGACRIHGDVEMGTHTTNRSLRWTLEMTQVTLLLSNIYAAADLGEFRAKSQHQRKEKCEETGSLWQMAPQVLQQMIRVQSAEIPA